MALNFCHYVLIKIILHKLLIYILKVYIYTHTHLKLCVEGTHWDSDFVGGCGLKHSLLNLTTWGLF